MFDNILGQESVVSELKRDVINQALPGALLFHGPELSGKNTTALELARALMCEKSIADWGCDCKGCGQNRVLEHPYLLMLGCRNFLDEIRAAGDAVARTKLPAARYLLVRAVRKLTRRFDRVLWEDVESRLASVSGQLGDLEDVIETFARDEPLPADGELAKRIESIIDLSEKVSAKLNRDNIPIHQIRKTSYWAHTTTQNVSKVIIIDNADKMLAGSRNALLKILEEPPVDTFFILLTARKESIIPTLKSRLRQFHFADRSEKVTREILRRVFRETSDEYASLKEYFLAWSTNPRTLKRECDRFYQSLFSRNPELFFLSEEGDSPFLEDLEDRRIFSAFLNELVNTGQRIFRQRIESGVSMGENIELFETWNGLLRRQYALLESLNLHPRLLTENLFQDMLEAV